MEHSKYRQNTGKIPSKYREFLLTPLLQNGLSLFHSLESVGNLSLETVFRFKTFLAYFVSRKFFTNEFANKNVVIRIFWYSTTGKVRFCIEFPGALKVLNSDQHFALVQEAPGHGKIFRKF